MKKSIYSKLHIEFADAPASLQPSLRLSFQIADHSAAQKWAHCIAQSQAHSQLLEDKRWYNFPGKKMSSLPKIALELEGVIHRLNELHPGLITEKPDPENLQDSVNRLHTHFADSHLVKNRITEISHDAWFEFNNLLHAFEAVERSLQVEPQAQIPNASIVFTWKDNFNTPLAELDYQEFTIAKKFGTCYINYCQVGRHLFEMFQAQDHELADEHILPLRNASADTYLWFGQSTGPQGFKRKMQDIETWFFKNEEHFKRLGFKWGDPKLAIGWIPVASLEKDLRNLSDQKDMIQKISQMDRIANCIVE